MFLIIFILLFIILFIYFKKQHINIDYKSLTKPKLKIIDDRHGEFLVTGKQGSNKTYYAIAYLLKQSPKVCNYVKTNIKSLKLDNFKIEYFDKIDEIVHDTDEHCIYVIDEISRKYKKNSPCDTQFYAWLNQCRKRKRIAILITQEYLELPMWLRRPCKFMFNSKSIPLLSNWFGLYACIVGDGYNLQFDKDLGEYICPTIKTIIYKRNKFVASKYDTFEPINDL